MLKVILAMVAAVSFAASAKGMKDKDKHQDMMKACEPLKQACEAAGFKLGDHKETGKGLMVDCMSKWNKGEKVEGVALDPADPSMKTCKEHMAMAKNMKMEKKAGKGTAPPAGTPGTESKETH
jgi:hypothetical protein